MKVYDFGADWLTLTNVLQFQKDFGPLMQHFLALSRITTPWQGLGYKGYQDPDRGLKYGSRIRKDTLADELFILPGKEADRGLKDVPALARYRATRFDIQVTVELDKPDQRLASDLYEKMVAMARLDEPLTGRRQVKMIRSATGDTLYVGTRKSGRKFFRLYDRSIASGEELGLIWRQEIQYGRDMADEALERYEYLKGNETAIINLVCAEFQDGLGYSLLPDKELPNNVPRGTTKPSPPLRAKLRWLEDCVKPTISLMLNENMETEMLQALGLAKASPWEKREAKRKQYYDSN